MARILHAADFHLDTPFSSMSAEHAAELRRAQKSALEAMVALANRAGVDMLLLAGDLLDSEGLYRETRSFLPELLSGTRARVFIAPGNHDRYSASSPYAEERFSDNVHIFCRPVIEAVELPELGCTVWGAGFDSRYIDSALLGGFSVPQDGRCHIMVMHGDPNPGSMYNPVTEADVAASGLDYLALGHVHAYGGVLKAGKTTWAWPGCPQGRGFDETGERGVLLGEVTCEEVKLAFVPLAKHRYLSFTLDAGGGSAQQLLDSLEAAEDDLVRITLTGETDGGVAAELYRLMQEKFFHAELRDRTVPRRELWALAEENSLKGLFVRRMRAAYDAAVDDEGRALVTAALREGINVLENREEGTV